MDRRSFVKWLGVGTGGILVAPASSLADIARHVPPPQPVLSPALEEHAKDFLVNHTHDDTRSYVVQTPGQMTYHSAGRPVEHLGPAVRDPNYKHAHLPLYLPDGTLNPVCLT